MTKFFKYMFFIFLVNAAWANSIVILNKHDSVIKAANPFYDYGENKVVWDSIPREYTQIDVNLSNQAIEKLVSKNSTSAKIQAQEMLQNLGNYNPPALIRLAVYLRQHHHAQAFQVFQLAKIRTAIDVDMMSKSDRSVSDCYNILIATFYKGSYTDSMRDMSDEQIKELAVLSEHYFKENIQKLLIIDNQIARNYDVRWPLLHGMGIHVNKPISAVDNGVYNNSVEEIHKFFSEKYGAH